MVLCLGNYQSSWMFSQKILAFGTSCNCWLFVGGLVNFLLCRRIVRNILQPVTGNIVFVSPHWEEIRLNLVSTDCSGLLTRNILERNSTCVNFVGKDLLIAVNWRNMAFHILERSCTCEWHVVRGTYNVGIYGDTDWLTQVKNLSVAHSVVRGDNR